jgi:TPR repeat protein
MKLNFTTNMPSFAFLRNQSRAPTATLLIVIVLLVINMCWSCYAQEGDPGSNPNAKGKNLYKYYIKAAEAGNSFAQLAIAGCYDTGEWISKNPQEAIKWYRKAAENGLPSAQYIMAWKFLDGDGIPKDITEAVSWFRKATTNGSSSAQCKLGEIYFNGGEVAKDNTEAIYWFRKAAEQGEVVGQNNLGYIYANGKGVPKDFVESYKWFSEAARGGNEKAAEILKALERQMAKEQIADAKQASVELAKKIDSIKDRLLKESAHRALKWSKEIETINKKYSNSKIGN